MKEAFSGFQTCFFAFLSECLYLKVQCEFAGNCSIAELKPVLVWFSSLWCCALSFLILGEKALLDECKTFVLEVEVVGHCSNLFFFFFGRHGATSSEVYRNCGRGTRPKRDRELISLLKKICQKSFSLQPSPLRLGPCAWWKRLI